MARPTKRAVGARVRYWRKILGLSDWTIAVEFGSDEDENDASCSAMPEYRQATVRFDLNVVTVEKLDEFCVHELAHCLSWRLTNAAHTLCAGDAGKEEWVRTEDETLITHLEKVILHLARSRE